MLGLLGLGICFLVIGIPVAREGFLQIKITNQKRKELGYMPASIIGDVTLLILGGALAILGGTIIFISATKL